MGLFPTPPKTQPATIRRNTQKRPSKDPKQKHAGGSTEKHVKLPTHLTEPQGIIKNGKAREVINPSYRTARYN